METNPSAPASSTNLKVAYHSGGLLFAGDERDFPAGWYLFDGKDAYPVTVFEPFSNDQIVVAQLAPPRFGAYAARRWRRTCGKKCLHTNNVRV